MKQIVHWLRRTYDVITAEFPAWLVFVLMWLVVVEVTARYVFNSPFAVADEVGADMLVVISFIGLAYAWKQRSHIHIDVVVSRLPGKVRNRLRVITNCMALAFIPVLVFAFYKMVAHSAKIGLKSEDWMRLPLQWVQLFMLVGLAVVFIAIAIDLVSNTKSLWNSKEDSE